MTQEDEEIIDVIDEQDRVIGQAKRGDLARKRLSHRVCSIILENDKGEILLQKRSLSKSSHPGLFGLSAGGLVSSGESYAQSIEREAQEEIGISIKPQPFDSVQIPGDSYYTSFANVKIPHQDYFVFEQLFVATYNGSDFKIQAAEVDSVKFMPLQEVIALTRTHPELFMPSFIRYTFPAYLAYKNLTLN